MDYRRIWFIRYRSRRCFFIPFRLSREPLPRSRSFFSSFSSTSIAGPYRDHRLPRQPVLRTAMVGLAGIALVSLIAVLAYPSVAPFVNSLIDRAYHDKGPAFLSAALAKRHRGSGGEQYLYRAGQLLSPVFSKLFLVSSVSFGAMMAIAQRQKLEAVSHGGRHRCGAELLGDLVAHPSRRLLAHADVHASIHVPLVIPFVAV